MFFKNSSTEVVGVGGESVVRYITSIKDLEKTMEKKRMNGNEIEKIIDGWMGNYCNTSLTFSEIQDKLYKSGVLDGDADVTLLFGRQLPTCKLEHAVLLEVCKAVGNHLAGDLGIEYAVSMPSLPIDVMHSKNIEKRCYAEIIMADGGKDYGMDLKKVGIASIKDMHPLEAHHLKLNGDKAEILESYFGTSIKEKQESLPEFHRSITEEKLDGEANYNSIADVYRNVTAHLLDDVENGRKPYIQGVWASQPEGKAVLYLIDVNRRTACPARKTEKEEEISISELKDMKPWITAREAYNYLIHSTLAYNPDAIYVVRDGLPGGKFQPAQALKLQETMARELNIPKAPIADFSIEREAVHPAVLRAVSATPYTKKLGYDDVEVALQLYLPEMETDLNNIKTAVEDEDLSTVAGVATRSLCEKVVTGVEGNGILKARRS